MYYVDRWQQYYANNKKLRHKSAVFAVFVVLIFTTILISFIAYQSTYGSQAQMLKKSMDVTDQSLRSRLGYYDVMLAGMNGFFTANFLPTDNTWETYVAQLQISLKHPEVTAAGFALKDYYPQAIATSQKLRSEHNLPNLSILGRQTDKDDAMLVSYIYPEIGINASALGYDLYSEKNRKDAIDMAASKNQTVISHPITSIVKDAPKNDVYLLLLSPTWESRDKPLNQANLKGVVFVGFATKSVFSGIDDNKNGYAFRLEDTYDVSPNEIFETPGYQAISESQVMMKNEKIIEIYGQKWRLIGVGTTYIVSQQERYRPLIIFSIGSLLSIISALFVYLLLQRRIALVGRQQERSLNEAKNELLALASHQLRTPATGVKQYLGIVLDGYAGKLDNKQAKYLRKAYQSNERQLSTINEMLFVAKSDIGKLEMNRKTVNISALLEDIVSEQKSVLKSRRQSVIYNYPKSDYYVIGDLRYLRMALENIFSNATKYTYNGGEITISIKKYKKFIRIIIKDNGVGIDNKDRHLLFKKFSRIPNELTNKVGGSGIGLYLAKKIVEVHGGAIDIKSEKGVGTECMLTLPIN